MIFILWGQQFWARKKLGELLSKALEKEAAVFKLNPDHYLPLASYFSGELFGKKVIVVGEDLLQNPEYEKEIKELLPTLVSAPNIIFLLEEKLAEGWRESFRAAGAKLQEFKTPPDEKFLAWAEGEAERAGVSILRSELGRLAAELEYDPWAVLVKLERLSLEGGTSVKMPKAFVGEPNYFQFADLASGKKKYPALRLLRAYLRAGLGAEEAFWKLWWKVKTLRMVDSGAKGLGLHPFVLKKASEDLKNFSSQDLKTLSYELLDIFSEARRGETTFEEGLERLLLKL